MLNGHACGHLPHQIGALYELAHLHPGDIHRCVAEGLIRSAMTRIQARTLVVQLKGANVGIPAVKPNILRRLDGLGQWFLDNGAELDQGVLQQAREKAARLSEIVAEELDRSAARSIASTS